MLGNLLTNVILWVYSTLQSVFSTTDYRIADTSMEYFLDTTKTPLPEELDEFCTKSVTNGMTRPKVFSKH